MRRRHADPGPPKGAYGLVKTGTESSLSTGPCVGLPAATPVGTPDPATAVSPRRAPALPANAFGNQAARAVNTGGVELEEFKIFER